MDIRIQNSQKISIRNNYTLILPILIRRITIRLTINKLYFLFYYIILYFLKF